MEAPETKLIHISFSDINFTCPHCEKQYCDNQDKYLNRCQKNKSMITTIRCSCKQRFGMTYDMFGNAVSFKL